MNQPSLADKSLGILIYS